jgi:hypothetical protein
MTRVTVMRKEQATATATATATAKERLRDLILDWFGDKHV